MKGLTVNRAALHCGFLPDWAMIRLEKMVSQQIIVTNQATALEKAASQTA